MQRTDGISRRQLCQFAEEEEYGDTAEAREILLAVAVVVAVAVAVATGLGLVTFHRTAGARDRPLISIEIW